MHNDIKMTGLFLSLFFICFIVTTLLLASIMQMNQVQRESACNYAIVTVGKNGGTRDDGRVHIQDLPVCDFIIIRGSHDK